MTIFTICFNEEFILPFFIAHYRKNFPACRIVIYDNESTDNSKKIALAAGCEVINYSTNGKLDDKTYLEIKNNCWKSTRGWVIVCDCDEFCDIDEQIIDAEWRKESNIIRFTGYNMVNLNDNLDFHSIKSGVRSESYDKNYCFNSNDIAEMYFNAGCHTANPIGDLVFSNDKYICRHYKYINPDYMVKRHAAFAERLSEENIKRGYGGHYLYPEQEIRDEFTAARNKSIRIL